MGNPWFRFHAEALDDPKVQTLSTEVFKFWVNMLCLACKHNGKLPSIEAMVFSLRATLDETERAFHTLVNAGLIDEHKNQFGLSFTPHNWSKRQYKSDTSTERVKRYRNTPRNRKVTPSESDTEQKQIKERMALSGKPKPPVFSLNGLQESFEYFWQSYPKKTGKGAAEKAWRKIKPSAELAEMMNQKIAIQNQSSQWSENDGKFIPSPSKWLNEKRWEDEPMVSEKRDPTMQEWL